MDTRKYLGQKLLVTMDRPLGTPHPKRPEMIYPVNYGFIPNTVSGDGEELDAYVLAVEEPKHEFTGVCVAIIHRTNDNDDKLIVVPEGVVLTDEDIRKATHFQEQFFESVIWR